MKIIRILFFLLIGIIGLTSCEKKEEPVPPLMADRTVLVYMVADNLNYLPVAENLESMAEGYLKASQVGNLIVYLHDKGKNPELIQFLKKNEDIERKVIRSYPDQNSASGSVLAAVCQEVYSSFPARSKGLILWSHASGWLPPQSKTSGAAQYSFGNDRGKEMSILDLRTALSGQKIDFLIFDACTMAQAEVVYELRHDVQYIVASAAEIISDGFPYKDIVPSIYIDDLETCVTQIARDYMKYYREEARWKYGMISVIKSSEMERLAEETGALMRNHTEQLNAISANNANNVQRYDRNATLYNHYIYDIQHFVEQFTTADERISFEKQLDKTLLFTDITDEFLFPINHYSGLGIYIPQSNYPDRNLAYHEFEWYSAVGWDLTDW